MGARHKLLSIDFDFLPYSGAHDRLFDIATARPVAGKGAFEWSYRAFSAFEWSHGEHTTPELERVRWGSRVLWWQQAYGEDLQRWVSIDPARGCTTPREFADALRERWRLDGGPEEFRWADSHVFAFWLAKDLAIRHGPLRLIHFDAHHDLGYSKPALKWMRKQKAVDCSAWLYFALHYGLVAKATIVYPDWRGSGEGPMAAAPWISKLRKSKRLKFVNWSRWATHRRAATDRPSIFLCRSSSWTPPWLDAEFEQLRGLLAGLDVPAPCDACEPRTWDRDRAVAEARLMHAGGFSIGPRAILAQITTRSFADAPCTADVGTARSNVTKRPPFARASASR